MIGIIGYGYVGKAVDNAFNCETIICDPKHNTTTIDDVVSCFPDCLFVCVPTNPDEPNFLTLLSVLDDINKTEYNGPVVVKSTVLPGYIKGANIVYNPEFLTQRTSDADFIAPEMIVMSGERAMEVVDIYKKYSNVVINNLHITDINTACLLKYTMNCFYGLKICYMNYIYDIAKSTDVNYDNLIEILKEHPWMGTHHFDVPGPDGRKGFGGACLPKDMLMFTNEHDVPLLKHVLKYNHKQRFS
jgi:UDPglucose 6-dehydrogenase